MISLDATKNERADQLVRILCVPPDCTANAKQIGGEGQYRRSARIECGR
jgi:hypothetical protein